MPRKIAVFVGALSLAAAVLLVGVGGVGLRFALAASYNYPCASYQYENNYHWWVERTGLSFDKAQGQTTIGTYLACTNAQAGFSASMTIIATIQGGPNLAQCAVGQLTGEGTKYWYTPLNNGAWFAFPTQPRLQYGDVVQCAVYSTGSGHWSYALTNITTNQTVYGSSSRSGYGDTAWWGHEIDDDGDQFGGELGLERNSVTYPAYSYVGSSSLWYATGDSGAGLIGTQRSWMYPGVSHIGSGQYDSIDANAAFH